MSTFDKSEETYGNQKLSPDEQETALIHLGMLMLKASDASAFIDQFLHVPMSEALSIRDAYAGDLDYSQEEISQLREGEK